MSGEGGGRRGRALASLPELAPTVRAEVLNLAASLRCDQRRFHEALTFIGFAIELYEKAGDPHMVGEKLMVKARGERKGGQAAAHRGAGRVPAASTARSDASVRAADASIATHGGRRGRGFPQRGFCACGGAKAAQSTGATGAKYRTGPRNEELSTQSIGGSARPSATKRANS